MAALRKSRAARACAAALVALLALPWPAWGLGLPSTPTLASPTLAPPPVRLSTPSVPSVQASTPSVPSVQLSTPSVPSVHLSTPSVPSVGASAPTTPSVHVSTPSVPSVQLSTPSVPSASVSGSGTKAPTVSPSGSSGPSVSVSGAHAPSLSHPASSTLPSSRAGGATGSWQQNHTAGAAPASGRRSGGGPYAPSRSGSRPQLGGHSQALVFELTARRLVQRLAGCLGNLPSRLRMVLVLRTGVGLSRAYGPATVAALLHVGTREVAGLERRALAQLRLTAGSHNCTAAGQTLAASALFGAFGPPAWEAALTGGEAGEGGAAGEVKDLRYATHSPRERPGPAGKHGYPNGDALLGVNVPPGSADTWLMALIIVAAVALAAFLFLDERWRARWLPRRPR
jgi:hypothetical protein